jgi:hypothetical protein
MRYRATGTVHRAIIATEAVVGIALAILIAAIATDAVFDYRKATDLDRWSRAAGWAAEAQLQRFQARAPLDSSPPAGLIPDEITLKTTRAAGQGSWAGFHRVTVTADAVIPAGRTVHSQVTGYVPAEDRP